MKNKTPIIIIFSAIVILVALFFIYFFSNQKKYKWYETYRADDKQPYGCYVVSELLKDYFPSQSFKQLNKPMHQSLDTVCVNTNYIFIGNTMYGDSEDFAMLLSFVDKGNDAFLAAKNFPDEISHPLLNTGKGFYDEEKEEYLEKDICKTFTDSVAEMNFYQPDFKKPGSFHYKYLFENKSNDYEWSFFDSLLMADSAWQWIALGSIKSDLPNFIKVPYGKGNFFLHCNPFVFTNYNLLKPEPVNYAEKIFSHLPEGNILWDERSKRPMHSSQSIDQFGESPLRYILSQTALKWAYYLILIMALFYMVFRAKRKQKIIPILDPNTNTSLEFIHTIGRLYFQQHDHKIIAQQKMKLFLSFVRNKYRIPTKEINPDVIERIAERSKLPKAAVSSIFGQYSIISRDTSVSENTLIEFYQTIENFYKHCA